MFSEDEEAAVRWLLSEMRGTNLHMDGTMVWSLSHRHMSGIRARNALEAVQKAHERFRAWSTKEPIERPREAPNASNERRPRG